MEHTFNDKSYKHLRRALRNNSTPAEQILWRYLKGKQMLGYKFRRQFGIGKYIVDFYCPRLKLVIEVDGDTHFDSKNIQRDHIRQQDIESLGIKVIRFTNTEVYENLEEVLAAIRNYLP
jgi:very-short-patch-repair endonuclease